MASILTFHPASSPPREDKGSGDADAAEDGMIIIFPGIRISRWHDARRSDRRGTDRRATGETREH